MIKKWMYIAMTVLLVATTGGSFASTAPNVDNMIYLYAGNSETYKRQLTETEGQVGTLLPGYFNISEDGSLIETVDPEFVAYAHDNQYRVTPFISNHWDRELGIKAMENGEALARQIADAVRDYNLDGVNVDIENLTYEQRDLQTKFLKALRDHLRPLGKTVTIAVAPAQKDTTIGWAGSYDFEAIGQIVDGVFIMGYDQSYPQGPEGPVAGLRWVEQSVQYLTQKIPRDKLILGVPFYGRYWTETEKGAGIVYPQTLKLIQQNGAEVKLDSAHQTNVSKFYDKASGKNYEIWFDSAETLLKKIELVEKYGLKGWGAWRLGQEDPAFWATLAGNAPLFTDIEGHWAQHEIRSMAEQKLITGYTDRSFRPQNAVTREETATLLASILGLDTSNKQSHFKDVPRERWSYPFVSAISKNGAMTGYPDQHFRPSEPITRAEFASSLARMMPTSAETVHSDNESFTDVVDHWAEDAILLMKQAGLIAGYEDGSFRPNQTVTRAEAAVMLSKFLQK